LTSNKEDSQVGSEKFGNSHGNINILLNLVEHFRSYITRRTEREILFHGVEEIKRLSLISNKEDLQVDTTKL